jgi:AhpD family alkylhydroperoxidase
VPDLRAEPPERSAATSSLLALPWGECILPSVDVPDTLAADVERQLGARPLWLSRLGRCPWLARLDAALSSIPVAFVEPRLCQLVVLIVSQDNSCRYCYGVQRSLLRIAGYDEHAIERLERDLASADLAPVERDALELARRVSRANPRPGAPDFAPLLTAGMALPAVVEIAAIAAASGFLNRVSTFTALPPEVELEAVPTRPFFRLVRPFLAWRTRPVRRTPEPPPPVAEPFGRLVAALGTSPIAGIFRRLVDELFGAPALPRRTKALLCAVVARALGCRYVEDEARRLLAADGFDDAATDEVLATLASPALSPLERRLVPFARETVRFQPAAIQQRVREVTHDLDPDAALEMIVTTAAANALGRLSVVLDLC